MKPLTVEEAARILAWRAIEYAGVPRRRGRRTIYVRQPDNMLDCDQELYDMARRVLALLPATHRNRPSNRETKALLG